MKDLIFHPTSLNKYIFTYFLLFLHTTSVAQPIEEIVVTATKRGTELIQEVPSSIQAISGDYLQEIGALDFNDYYRQISGLSINDQGPGDKRYIIRGVSSRGFGTVGLYFDEVIITGENLNSEGGRQPDIKMFDIERIEVLKGPQGTTFGSSSLSGTIRWIPAQPDMSTYAAEIGTGLSTTRYSGGASWNVDGMVNIPIIKDKLAVRLSGIKTDKRGYIDTQFDENTNDDETEAIRAIITWQATDALKASFMYLHQDLITNGRPGFMDQQIRLAASPTLNGGPVPKNFNTDLSDGIFDDSIDIFNLKFEYARDWGTITATTSLFQRDTVFDRDASSRIEVLTRGAFPADGTGRTFIIQPQDREVFSNEIRFASNWDGAFQVLAGAFYSEENRDFRSAVPTVDAQTGKITPTSTFLLDRTVFTQVDEVALFGELSWDVTDQLTLTGGIRWFDFELTQQTDAATGFPGRPGPGPAAPEAFSEDDIIFKANASYKLTEDILAYFQFAQGFRSGGTNDQTAALIAGVTIPAGFKSDGIDNYEIGIKSTWFDNKLTLNAAVYRIDWTDIQAQSSTFGGNIVTTFRSNGGKAKVNGVELEMQAYPNTGLQLGMILNYSDARLTEDLPRPRDGVSGNELPYVPELTFSMNGRYERPVGPDGWTGFISGDFSWVNDQNNRLSHTIGAFRTIQDYSILNLRIGVEDSDWSATLAVNNVFDEDETIGFTFNGTNGIQPPNGFVPPSQIRPWPRTVLFNVRKSFDF